MSVQEHLNKIRNAIYGREVRESIAKGIETAYDDASENGNANMEVKIARGTHPNLRSRLDEVDDKQQQTTAQLQQTEQELNAQLAQKVTKDESGSITYAMASQDFREQITGGNTAVVGVDAILEENLTNGAVTPNKTSFTNPSKNIFNGEYVNGMLSGLPITAYIVGGDNKSAILKIDPNTTYAISHSGNTDRFRLATFSNNPIIYTESVISSTNADGLLSTILTTESNAKYLVIYVSTNTTIPEWLQVEVGETVTEYSPHSAVSFNLDNVKMIQPSMTTFIKKSKNLFDGKYLANTYINTTGGLQTSAGSRTSFPIPCKPNTFYTVSGGNRARFRFLTSANTYISFKASKHALSPSNASYMQVYYTSDGLQDKIQIEEGGKATQYISDYALEEDILGVEDSKIQMNYLLDGVSNTTYKPSVSPYNVTNVNTLNDLYAIYDNLVTLYPDYITKELLGTETSGLPIYKYEFKPTIPQGTTTMDFTKILYVSGTHGAESKAVLDGVAFFTDLSNNWKNDEALQFLRWNVHFIVVPVLNPYGFENLTRKNANGVDLNRNFPVGWTANADTTSNNYPGVSPLSEIESQCINTLLNNNPDILFAVDNHNYGTYPLHNSSIRWSHSFSDKVIKMLLGYSIQLNSQIKKDYQFLPQDNTNLMAILTRSPEGQLYQYFEAKGVAGIIFEAAQDFGGTTEDLHKFGSYAIGNLVLTAIRNYDELY